VDKEQIPNGVLSLPRILLEEFGKKEYRNPKIHELLTIFPEQNEPVQNTNCSKKTVQHGVHNSVPWLIN